MRLAGSMQRTHLSLPSWSNTSVWAGSAGGLGVLNILSKTVIGGRRPACSVAHSSILAYARQSCLAITCVRLKLSWTASSRGCHDMASLALRSAQVLPKIRSWACGPLHSAAARPWPRIQMTSVPGIVSSRSFSTSSHKSRCGVHGASVFQRLCHPSTTTWQSRYNIGRNREHGSRCLSQNTRQYSSAPSALCRCPGSVPAAFGPIRKAPALPKCR